MGSGRVDDSAKDGAIVKPNVEKGATVMYSKYSGIEFQDDDEKEYIVVRESDIIASLS